MSAADRVLTEGFAEAEAMFSAVPTDVNELLSLLNQIEVLLSKVEQSPSPLLQRAYQPTMRALLNEAFIRHPDLDVKVAVARCISEITRITAPEMPYKDDEMKDIFKLIVSSFENLADKYSRSYDKRVMILETAAKVRSCVVMLDLECDVLLVEMFEHFLNSIRDYHPMSAFNSMETIMVLVLEESEDISLELLKPLLASVRTDNEQVSTTARKLGESVLEKCAAKLKLYLKQAVKLLGVPLNSYGKVVASICQGGSASFDVDDKRSGEQLVKVHVNEEPEEVHPEAEMCITSNGMKGIESEMLTSAETSLEPSETSEIVDRKSTTNLVSDYSDSTGFVCSDIVPEHRGRKSDSLLSSTHPSDSSQVDDNKEIEITGVEISEKEATKSCYPQTSDGKDAYNSFSEDQHEDTGASSANEKGIGAKTTPKVVVTEAENFISLNPIESLPDESFHKDTREPNKKEDLIQDALSTNPVPTNLANGNSDSDGKSQGHFEKGKENLSQEDGSTLDPVSNRIGDATSDSGLKMHKHSGKKEASLALEDALYVDPVSANIADKTSDSEVIPQNFSGKKKRNVDLEDAPCLDNLSVEIPNVTIELAVKQKRLSGKKENNLVQESAPSWDPGSQKVADGTNDSEMKPLRRTGKRTARVKREKYILFGRGGTSKTEGEASSDSEANALMQCAMKGDGSDSEAKPLKQSGKKGQTIKTSGKPLKQSGKKRDTSDSDTKLLKKLDKKVDNSNEDKVPVKENNVKRRGCVKETREQKSSVSRPKDDQEMFSSPKFTSKPVKDEESSKEPKNNSKRKQAVGKNKVSERVEVGANLVGSKVKVWWPKDRKFYEGVIASFNPDMKKHQVSYDDGDEEILNLSKEKWKLIEAGTMEEEVNEDSDPDCSAKIGGTSKTEGEASSDSEANALMQCAEKGDGSDSEAKPHKQLGKKGQTIKTSGNPLKQSGKKRDTSDSDTKLLKRMDKKVDNSNEDKVPVKENNVKRRGCRKETREWKSSISCAKDDQEMFSSPNFTSKSVKGEESSKEPKNNSKRKQAVGENKVSEWVEVGANLVGSKVKVWWPKDRKFYEGVIASFDPDMKKHQVSYNDGDKENLNLSKEKWKLIEAGTMEEEVNEDSDPDCSAKMHKKKKAKTNSGSSPKQNQIDMSLKRVRGASSSESRSATTKRLRKSEESSDEDLLRAASKDKDSGIPKMTTRSNRKPSTKTKGKSPGNKSNKQGRENLVHRR